MYSLDSDGWWQNGKEITIPVPIGVIEEAAGGREPNGPLRLPLPIDSKARVVFPLRLGEHDLGSWQVVGVDMNVTRDGSEFVATLRPVANMKVKVEGPK